MISPTLLSPSSQIKFTGQIVRPYVIDARAAGSFYMMHLVQSDMALGLTGANGMPLTTAVWSYQLIDENGVPVGGQPIYNPTFLTSTGVPIQVTWMNMLPVTPNATGTPHLLPIDTSILMGMGGMGGMTDPNAIPTVVHLHGAHVASIYDGFPTSTITQMDLGGMGGGMGNMGGATATVTYDNSQQGTMLWYHDHSLGLTRTNVFSGLAATYYIEDQNRRDLATAGVLPTLLGANHTSLMIADKSFTSTGQLYYPGAAPTDILPGQFDPVTGLPVTVADMLDPLFAVPVDQGDSAASSRPPCRNISATSSWSTAKPGPMRTSPRARWSSIW